jgi:hypothetical protein
VFEPGILQLNVLFARMCHICIGNGCMKCIGGCVGGLLMLLEVYLQLFLLIHSDSFWRIWQIYDCCGLSAQVTLRSNRLHDSCCELMADKGFSR